MSDILDKINSRGYWRVVIRPNEYNEERLSNLKQISEIVHSSVLHLRGWDYPHIETKNLTNGQNYLQSFVDFSTYKEFWRFYQSGQFVHRFGMREDWQQDHVSLLGQKTNPLTFKGLEIIEILYNSTEIIEFASRLAAKGIYGKAVKIEISLHDLKDRKLFFWNRSRYLSREYICSITELKWEKSINTEELIGNSQDIAMDVLMYILERFNWYPSIDIFKEEQQNLISGRF